MSGVLSSGEADVLRGFVTPGELQDGELRLELSSFEVNAIHQVPTYSFRMLQAETGEELGWIRLRAGRGAHVERYAGHIGYAVHEAHRGHGYAGKSLRLVARFARRLRFDGLWITCDPENVASRRTLERVGAELVEEVDVPADCVIHQAGHPRKCRYLLDVRKAGQLGM